MAAATTEYICGGIKRCRFLQYSATMSSVSLDILSSYLACDRRVMALLRGKAYRMSHF